MTASILRCGTNDTDIIHVVTMGTAIKKKSHVAIK